MNQTSKVVLIVGLIGLGANLAHADEARLLADRVIRATAGSSDGLARLQSFTQRSRGTLFLPIGEVAVTRTAFYSLPDRLKFVAELGPSGQTQKMIFALNHLKGWHQGGGAARDLSAAEFDVLQDEAYFWWMSTLLPLKQRDITLTYAPPDKWNNRTVVGLKTSQPGRSSVELIFDTDSMLLVRGLYKVREASLEVSRECQLSAHRDFDGVKLPTRLTVLQNGRKIEDWTVESYRLNESLNKETFVKP